MKKLKYLPIIIFLCMHLLPVGVFAQSQEDLNPEFDASSDEQRSILLNYDCSNLPWPQPDPKTGKQTIGTYRKFTLDNPLVPVTTYYVPEGVSTLDIELNPSKYTPVPAPELIASGELAGKVGCYTGERDIDGDPVFIQANLIPPAIQQVENFVLKAVFLFWGFLGLFSTFSLMYIGLKYLLSLGNTIRNQEVLTQGAYWLLGLVLAIITIPGLYFVFERLNISTTECYKYVAPDGSNELVYDLTVPGFTFFFADVCTGTYAIENPPAN